MAGAPGRSGGANRLSLETHLARGTFRPDRHGPRTEALPVPVSAADRRRTLDGLGGEARRVSSCLLVEFGGWDASSLATLRAYALSCQRVANLEQVADADTRPLHREIRCNLQLARSLRLEGPR